MTDWNPSSPGPDQFCSGTLVSPTLFLTAAHCLVGAPASQQIWVTFDPEYDEEAASPGGLYAATSWTTHELFGTHGLSNLYDLAIVTLARAPAVTPARLPALGLFDTFSQQQLRQLTFTTVGYGLVRTSKKRGPHGFIDKTVRMVAQQTLLSLQPAWLNLNMNPSTGSGGTCFGDSGGPHFLGGMTRTCSSHLPSRATQCAARRTRPTGSILSGPRSSCRVSRSFQRRSQRREGRRQRRPSGR